MIAVHPQRCPGRADRLRWITPAGVLPFTGPVAIAPAPLAALLDDGTLAGITLEPAAVVTRLGEGRAWQTDGARVRTALHAALDDPGGWSLAYAAEDDTEDDGEDAEPDGDAALLAAARQLIDGAVGRYARSHGGGIQLLAVRDGVVTVRLAGACRGCPAARITVHQYFERLLRRSCPHLRTVTDA